MRTWFQVTPQIMQEGMRADYRKVDRLSDRLRDRMKSASLLRVSTKGGTSITATFDRSLDWVKTSGLISTRYWSNLPAGEVFTTPKSVDGIFVCDGTAGDHFNAKYGDLSGSPMVLEIAGARLKSVKCERKRFGARNFGVIAIPMRTAIALGNWRSAQISD